VAKWMTNLVIKQWSNRWLNY